MKHDCTASTLPPCSCGDAAPAASSDALRAKILEQGPAKNAPRTETCRSLSNYPHPRGAPIKKLGPILLGLTAGFAQLAVAYAADLPARKAAPVEYVRICDAYGSAFFYIPGTDTCLRVGGTVVGEEQLYSVSYRMANAIFGLPNGPTTAAAFTKAGLGGFVPTPLQYGNPTGAPISTFQAVGRIELDARTSTELGALRTFLRVESVYGTEGNAATGGMTGIGNFVGSNYNNNTAFFAVPRETTILNKAFVQFAGLTAGRAQSFFDFYADAINYEMLRGSNATAGLFAYTYMFNEGLSGTLSIEDNVSRRDFIGSTIGSFDYGSSVGTPGFGTAYYGIPGGSRVPEIITNLRWDQPWGAVQISGAAHQLRTTLYSSPGAVAVTPTAYAFPVATSQDYGFATQAGVQLLLGKIAPDTFSEGDKLWVQATYEQGATGFIMGNNLNFNGGPVNGSDFYGYGNGGVKAGNGWSYRSFDCVWTAFHHCDKSRGWAVLAVFRHYWLPTLSSSFYGSYMGLRYSGAALADVGGGVGAVNTDEFRAATQLVWTPVKNFDIGSELMYVRANHLNRPVGLAPDIVLNTVGLPSWKGVNGALEGRVRVQRTF